MFTPEYLREKLLPRFQKQVDDSEGRFTRVEIWPEFLGEEGESCKLTWDDVPIELAGIQIGRMVRAESSFNWLLPSAWDGQGIPMQQ